MSSPISNSHAVLPTSSFRTNPETSANASNAGPSFVRSSGVDAKAAPVAQNENVSKAQAVPKFSSLELKRMGAEILSLYKEKYLDKGERYLDFSSEGKKYSIRGSDIRNILIHTDNGLIQLGHDGTPRPNHSLPVTDKQEMTLALMRTLATLRHIGEPSPAAGKSAAASAIPA